MTTANTATTRPDTIAGTRDTTGSERGVRTDGAGPTATSAAARPTPDAAPSDAPSRCARTHGARRSASTAKIAVAMVHAVACAAISTAAIAAPPTGGSDRRRLTGQRGQATTEYALVLLAAALVALLVVAWATAGGGAARVAALFNRVIDAVTSRV